MYLYKKLYYGFDERVLTSSIRVKDTHMSERYTN